MNGITRTIKTIQEKLALDNFVISILIAAGLALAFPVPGQYAPVVSNLVTFAIAGLFFLYGTRIHPKEALEALRHWKLHGLILTFTFIIFPIVGVLCHFLPSFILEPRLYAGLLFLTLVPSTVQSSVSFTSIAGANVPAAIVSASLSNILGVLITPILVIMMNFTQLLSVSGDVSVNAGSILDVVLQLLVPFLLGQLARPWIGNWVLEKNYILKYFDRGSILLVVYSAFSEGQREHIWSTLDIRSLLLLIALNVVIIGAMLYLTKFTALLCKFPEDDAIVVQFCGTKKSLTSGVPMAMVIFGDKNLGLMVLPLMIFHQVQLMMCSWLATYYARRRENKQEEPSVV